MIETEETLSKIAQATYSSNPPDEIDGYKLIHRTPTLLFYEKHHYIVVGVRGTKLNDSKDLQADALIPLGQLKNAPRYKEDEKEIIRFKMDHADSHFYATGHSLGSAIIDLLINKGLVNGAMTFNGAIEPHYIRHHNSNKRIYNEHDPLYALMGRFSINPIVRCNKPKSWWENLLSHIKYTKEAQKVYERFKAHKIENITHKPC